MALPFAADACLLASSFEADADDADDAAELADDAAAVFEDSALVSDAFAFVSDVFAAEADLAAALACWGRLREGAESYAKALASDILR
ncbi:hypothetical protein Q2907_004513 [Escherichia coli]|nr:hypothetical protein [Escherichia coli]